MTIDVCDLLPVHQLAQYYCFNHRKLSCHLRVICITGESSLKELYTHKIVDISLLV